MSEGTANAPNPIPATPQAPYEDLGLNTSQTPQPGLATEPPGMMPPLYQFTPQQETNTNALLAMIFGIVGIFSWIFSIPAVVLGFVALSQMKKEPLRYGNRGMAIAGIVTGFVGFVLPIVLLFVYVFFMMFFFFSMGM